ncbi:MAG: YggT family protein [Alphaproteobacteria bacterium]|nr:YggT family protein [Alphaproteobacteria bacterium]
MGQGHFFWSYVPFWLVNYGLAILAWTLVGRFMLSFMVAPDSRNYIWRWFRRLTDWLLPWIMFITPYAMPRTFVLPAAAVWVFVVRAAIVISMVGAGWAPRLGQGTPG